MSATAPANESIFETLTRLNLVSQGTASLFSEHTRDSRSIRVLRDALSHVIFIEAHQTGDEVYRRGTYQKDVRALTPDQSHDYEDLSDTNRRFEKYKQFILGKSICDFGCGAGSFLRRAQPYCRQAIGVELQEDYRERLKECGIACLDNLHELPSSLDTVFLFHSFEHLANPCPVLHSIKSKLRGNGQGRIILEVPHANDFLIEHLNLQEFIDFTLWSQHLILHTRNSLHAFLHDAGFTSVVIEGVQRYSLSNHLHWLKHKSPGGHKSNLSVLETPALASAYADALSRLDANDTLVATAAT